VPDIDPDKRRLVIYALTTSLLAGNKPIGETAVINAQTLPNRTHAEPGQLHHQIPGADITAVPRGACA